jgi:hypothetical protein
LNFKEKHLKVLQHFILKKHSNIYLRDIAEPLGYSVERIRQLKTKLLLEAFSFFEFDSKTANTIIAHTSYIQQASDCIFLNKIRKYYFDSEIEDIQDSIIYKAIGNIFKYTHSLFFRENEQDKVFAFLISNDINNLFDIESFTNDMESKTKSKRTEDESLNFEGYIFSFVKKFEQASFERVKKVCETIVENGFNTIVTIDGNIIFPQNANKNLPELILEVLQKLGRPAHVTEITSELQIAYADREFSETSIRSSALRIPSIISFGRTSTYGLKEWEIEKEGIRGGTIRDIAQEFLEKFDVPKHILEIEEYVLRFRDTNEKNIITNLKLDTDRRFVFFPGGVVGLTSKKYNVNSNTFNRLPNYAPQLVKKLLKNKKVSVQEIEQLTIDTFGIDQYQARYWLRQHRLKGTFSKFLIEQENKFAYE